MHVIQFATEQEARDYIDTHSVAGVPIYDELLEVWNVLLPNGRLLEELYR